MFRDPIGALLSLAPLPDHVFGHAVVSECEAGVLEGMIEQGLVVAAPPAGFVVCGACDDGESVPWEPVNDATGALVGISYVCESTGTEHTGPVEWMRRYRIDFAGLVRLVGTGLGAQQEPEEIEIGAAYRWPRLKVGQVPLVVAIARGLNAPDAEPRWRALSLSPQSIVLGVGPTPRPPVTIEPKATGAHRLSLWSFLDVDDAGQVIVDREQFEQEIEELRSDRPVVRAPTSSSLRQQAQLAELITEVTLRLRSARRAVLDGNGGEANGICTVLQSSDAVADIIGVHRSTVHRWREKGVVGMDRLDELLLKALDLESLRSWTG